MFTTSIRRAVSVLMSLILVISLACIPAMAAPNELKLAIDLQGTAVTVRAYIDDQTGLVKLTGTMGSEGQEISGTVALAGTGLCFTMPPFINEWYGIDCVNFLTNLESSILAPNSGSQFALDQETYDKIVTGYNQILASAAQAAQAAQSGSVAGISAIDTEAYQAIIQEKLMPGVSTQSFEDTITMDEVEIPSKVTMITVTSEALADTINALAEKAASDPAIAEIYNSNSGVKVSMTSEGERLSFEDAIAQIKSMAATISENSLGLSISVFEDAQTAAPYYGDLRLGTDAFAIGAEMKLTNSTFLLQMYTYQNEEYSIPAGIEASLDKYDQEGIECTLSLLADGKRAVMFNLVLTYAEDGTVSYVLNGETAEGSALCVKGTISAGSEMKITVDSINDQAINAILTIGEAEAEAVPEYAEILTMTEEQFAQFVQLIQQVAQIFAPAEAN